VQEHAAEARADAQRAAVQHGAGAGKEAWVFFFFFFFEKKQGQKKTRKKLTPKTFFFFFFPLLPSPPPPLLQTSHQAFSLLAMGPFLDRYITGDWVHAYGWTRASTLLAIASCVAAIGVNVSQFACLGRFSAVSYQVLGHSKTITVLVGGWAIFGDVITTRQALGMLLAVAGMVGYGVASSSAAAPSTPAAGASTASGAAAGTTPASTTAAAAVAAAAAALAGGGSKSASPSAGGGGASGDGEGFGGSSSRSPKLRSGGGLLPADANGAALSPGQRIRAAV
jgi:solute carrier family 35, member E3